MDAVLSALLQTLDKMKVVDLSPMLERGMPRWPTHPHTIIDPTVVHEHDGYFSQTLNMAEHTGAHVDAPAHTVPSRMQATMETVPVDYLIGRAIVYHVDHLNLGPGDTLSADDFLEYERAHGLKAEQGDIVLIDYGWMKRYWRTDAQAWFYAKNEPGLEDSAVKLFADRKVRAVGADTIATESPIKDGVVPYQIGHRELWLPNDILIIECLANLEQLPDQCLFVALPLRIKNGSGSPIRPVAVVPA